MSEKRADVYEQEESSADLLVPTIGMVCYVFEEIFLQEGNVGEIAEHISSTGKWMASI